jgi:tRNA(fMet)-specific endonuclease VapC
MAYLLDTNIVSAILRKSSSGAISRLEQSGPGTVMTSIIVAAEARFGIRKKGSAILANRLEELFARVAVAPFEAPADRHYAELRTELERRGHPISANDMLIAAHALALGCTLVTDNEREFRRVPDLKVENWIR